MMREPFFILGCVRSGTTLLRDLLRQHPDLACPEETHFFRWPEPFAGTDFRHIQENIPTLRQHRGLDGIDETRFRDLLDTATDRRELMDGYMRLFLAQKKMPGARWFDKTPQHVYGMLLIHALYPTSCFIHIHRNPLNVVASLKKGGVMTPQSVQGAINYWWESISIVDCFRVFRSDLVLDVSYENLTTNPLAELGRILSFLSEEREGFAFYVDDVYEERNLYSEILTAQEIRMVGDKLKHLMSFYGYPVA